MPLETEKLLVPGIELTYTPVVNFAMQQNKIPVIRSLSVKNIFVTDLNDITIEILSEPEFAYNWSQYIEFIPAGQNIDLEAVDLVISAKFLSELTEKVTGSLKVTLSAGGTKLNERHYSIELLSWDPFRKTKTTGDKELAWVASCHYQ